MEGRRFGFERRGFDFLKPHTDLVEQFPRLGILENHPDGADDRAFSGDDMVGGGRDHVAGGGGQGVNVGDHRLGFSGFHQCLVDLLAAVGCAAGRRDGNHDCLGRIIVRCILNQVEELLIVGDDAADVDAGDMVVAPAWFRVVQRQRCRHPNQDQHGQDSPEAELVPDAAAIGETFRICHEVFSD